MDSGEAGSGSAKGGYRRRIVPIVDAQFQWKYTLLVSSLGVAVTAIMGAFLYRAHGETTRLLELTEEYQMEAGRSDQLFLLYLIVLVVVMGVALAFWGLVVTHRISGPLYIVARYLSVLAAGQYPDMRPLRKRDELHEFFASFEEAVNAMRNRDIERLRDLEDALTAARRHADGDPKQALESLTGFVEREKETINEALGRT